MYVLTLIMAAVLGALHRADFDQHRLVPARFSSSRSGSRLRCLACSKTWRPAHRRPSSQAGTKDGVRRVQLVVKGLLWGLALGLMWYGVVLPHKASQLCRNGSELAAQITTYKSEAARRMGHLAITAFEGALRVIDQGTVLHKAGQTAQHLR